MGSLLRFLHQFSRVSLKNFYLFCLLSLRSEMSFCARAVAFLAPRRPEGCWPHASFGHHRQGLRARVQRLPMFSGRIPRAAEQRVPSGGWRDYGKGKKGEYFGIRYQVQLPKS